MTDLDDQMQLFTRHLGMRELRIGTRFGTGERIALLQQPGGNFKLELTERGEQNVLLHHAQRTDDLTDEIERLIEAGLREVRGAHRLEAAQAETALLEHRSGLKLQLIQYDPGSPDLPKGGAP